MENWSALGKPRREPCRVVRSFVSFIQSTAHATRAIWANMKIYKHISCSYIIHTVSHVILKLGYTPSHLHSHAHIHYLSFAPSTPAHKTYFSSYNTYISNQHAHTLCLQFVFLSLSFSPTLSLSLCEVPTGGSASGCMPSVTAGSHPRPPPPPPPPQGGWVG